MTENDGVMILFHFFYFEPLQLKLYEKYFELGKSSTGKCHLHKYWEILELVLLIDCRFQFEDRKGMGH